MNSDATTLANKYQQKTDKEHILSNPDTYIGSIEDVNDSLWILNDSGDKIIQKNIDYIPGLFKLFDEGLVNCRDHVIRMQTAVENNVPNSLPVTHIDVTISDDGTITMTNDGNGIDVAEHPEYKIWIPELIFGHLRTSTNYDKDEKKIVGGKNGFGFKLVLIWSTYGSVETVDHVRGLKYIQEFHNNLDVIGVPKISKCTKAKPYTKITFKPDYARFGLTNGLSSDVIALLKKRVYDVSAVTNKTLKVRCNSTQISVKTFQQYLDLYIGPKSQSARVYEEANNRWEYAVALSPNNEFMHVSFVNGIYTMKGGKHVDYIINQITKKLIKHIETKKKKHVQPNTIREQLILFVRSDIENPSFDSQTKDYMNTPTAKFGSSCVVSDKFIEKVASMGVMEAACSLTKTKENNSNKKTDGNKTRIINGIPKLTQANWAGTNKSHLCMLIICEGDSAKTGIISGLSSDDRNTIAVYPLKGKLLNVRGEELTKVYKNEEVLDLRKIIGLETDRVYRTMDDVHKYLNYGSIVFMTDQDLDGSHIKGLCINLFHNNWRSLTHLDGFIGFINTPILKAKKGKQIEQFYNEGQYEQWKHENNEGKGWSIKYYKGLGTSTKEEFVEYFKNKKIVGFKTSDESDNSIDMVFNKKRADDRKDWLKNFDRDLYLDTNKTLITYDDFINKEMIHFSKYDCDRSIPHLMDGMKTSLRKILFAAFKRNLVSEIKVAQFSGYVSEHACYHHGEQSLNMAIVGMAQNFIGSNNINVLVPAGQFGSRIKGGKDNASPRYIFTKLNPLTRFIYPKNDDDVLEYLYDDGTRVEPRFYLPILPMILVNGSEGIGTGFSTSIMCYNPRDIIKYLKFKLQMQSTDNIDLYPYYEGFTGEIIKTCETGYLFKGTYEKIEEDVIRVTELPIGFWTQNFKNHLETLLTEEKNVNGSKGRKQIIAHFNDNSKDENICFTITFVKGMLDELEHLQSEHGCNGVHKMFKLCTTKSTTNMHMFNHEDKLIKYLTVGEIIDEYYNVRLPFYETRKNSIITNLQEELLIIKNKVNYIDEVLNGTIVLVKKNKCQIIEMLKNKQFDMINDDNEYKYLLKMPMDSVCNEKVIKLNEEHNNLTRILDVTRNTTIHQMWLNDLNDFEQAYSDYIAERTVTLIEEEQQQSSVSNKKVKKTGKVVKMNKIAK